jgi:hypothetical protein
MPRNLVVECAGPSSKDIGIMTVGPIQTFVIDHEIYADDYLRDLLEHPGYRNMDEVRRRAQKLIPDDDRLRNYFVNKGDELLGST